MALITEGELLKGTEERDVIIGTANSPSGANTIYGFGGNDVIVGDGFVPFFNGENAENTSRESAISIDDPTMWSTQASPLLVVDTPHTTLIVEPGAGETRYFAVTIGAGETITLDVDFNAFIFDPADSPMLELYDANGKLLARESRGVPDDYGSYSYDEPRLSFTASTGGTYYIRVLEAGSDRVFEGTEIVFLNVSVTGHEATAASIVGDADTISGGPGVDIIYGMDGADVIHGGEGLDRSDGGTGDDRIYGEEGDDRLRGNDGDDRLVGGIGHDIIYGEAGNDSLSGGDGSDIMGGGIGDDTLYGGLDSDTLSGDAGNDVILGQDGIDSISGDGGSDYLDGGAGNDWITGGSGRDWLIGGSGADTMRGGDGNDTYVTDGLDRIEELDGEGIDTIRSIASYKLDDFVENLTLLEGAMDGRGNVEANVLIGNGNDNFLFGRDNDDEQYGKGGADIVAGGDGDDTLFGDAGDDRLIGGNGADLLVGGIGFDILEGGAGSDTYQFEEGDLAAAISRSDRIIGFSVADGEGDIISLQAIDADTTQAGNQIFDFIGTDAFTGNAGELRYFQTDAQTVIEMDTDGDGSADLYLRLKGSIDLTAGDFVF